MNVRRTLSRIALISLLAVMFAGLTALYGDTAPPSLPSASWQAFRRHRAGAPELDAFGEFLAEGMVVAIYAVAGRLLLRVRLSRSSPRTRTIVVELRDASFPGDVGE